MAASSAFQAAVEKMQSGDPAGAEALLSTAIRVARETAGPESAEYARACYEHGSCLAAQGQTGRALAAFRDACSVEPGGDAALTQARLTYLVQLGEVLELAGELDEAERVLRESLAGRASFYGKDHAGYGFGLEPLAAVLLRKGDVEGASTLCDQAVQNFASTGHERIATALALGAEIRKALDPDRAAFELIDAPPAFLEALTEAVLARRPARPGAWSDVLDELIALIDSKLGAGHPLTLRALSALANHEHGLGDEGDANRRQGALIRLVEVLDRSGNQQQQSVLGRLALALAESDAGAHDAALATYEVARGIARDLGDAALRAKVLRNQGLLLATMGRAELAEKRMRAALKLCKQAEDEREIQAARVALGIFLQHEGRKDEARGYLRRAADGPDPAHPDALCARSHLDAIESGSACGCGDMTSSIAATLERMVRAELADATLLGRLEVEPGADGLRVAVHLARNPVGDELALLQAAVQRAEAVLRERLRTGRSIAIDVS